MIFFLKNLMKSFVIFNNLQMIFIFLIWMYWFQFLIVSQFMTCQIKIFVILFEFLLKRNEIHFWIFLFRSWIFSAVWWFLRICFSKIFNVFFFFFAKVVMLKWILNLFHMNWIIVCFVKMSLSYNRLIFRNKYRLKIKFSSN